MGGVVNAVKEVVSTVTDTTVGIVSGEYLAKGTGAVLSIVGKDIVDDVLGLDKLGREIDRVGDQFTQVGKVLGGEYHDDVKRLEEYKSRLDSKSREYNSALDAFAERMESLIAFHEIFQMAIANRMDKYIEQYNPQLQAMMKEYQAMAAQLSNEYDFVIGLTQGSFLEKVIGSLLMIVGGIMSDMKDIMNGRADGETWKRVVVTTLTVAAVVALFFVPGLQGVALAVAVSLASITAFMTLDGMYANGAATGAIMGVLDTLFNDVLNLDDRIGSDFNKFDKDHADYQEMVMYTQLAMSLASLSAAWAGAGTQVSNIGTAGKMSTSSTAGAGGRALSTAGAEMTGQTLGTASRSAGAISSGSFLGVSFSTYSDIYKAYSTAQSIGDTIGANKQYEDLKNKLESDRIKVESLVENKYRKSFMKHYKDTAYFLQDQQEYIDRYLWGMTAQNMYVDPYGTTPVANIRFTPDKDTRVMSFGYEDMFDDSKMAGSKNYFNSIIYG